MEKNESSTMIAFHKTYVPRDSSSPVDRKTIMQFLEGKALSYKDFAQLLFEQDLWQGSERKIKNVIATLLVQMYRDGRQTYKSMRRTVIHITHEKLKKLALELAEKLDHLHAVKIVTEGVNFYAAPNGALLSVEVTDWREEPNFVISRFDFAEWKRYHKTDELPGIIQAVDVGYWYKRHDGEHRYEEPVAECRGKKVKGGQKPMDETEDHVFNNMVASNLPAGQEPADYIHSALEELGVEDPVVYQRIQYALER